MSLSLTRKTLARVAMVVAAPLLVVLIVANSAMGQSSAQQDQYGGNATLTFKVDTEGQVPEDATFLAFVGPGGVEAAPNQLTDPDGDGTYTGSFEVPKGEVAIKIVKGTGTEERFLAIAGREITFPGEPTTVIKEPQTITLDEDKTISATYTFSGKDGGQSPANPGNGDDQYGNGNDQYGNGNDQYGNGGDQGGNVSSGGDSEDVGGPGVLPDTGGAALLPAVGIGVLLIGGGLLARRILW